MLKKYSIHFVIFIIAVLVHLSIPYTISDTDDYYYFFGAINMLKNHAYLVNGNPVTYPLGYSLLIVPFFFIFGINVQSAVLSTAIFGALTVVLLYEFTKDLLNKRAALFASAFLLFSSHWAMSSVVMSDVPALFFMLLSVYAVVKYTKTKKPSYIYLFYVAFGFACLIRYMSLMVLIVLGLYVILSRKTHLFMKKDVWFGLPIFFLILSPQLIYNFKYFKHPFQTGYHVLHKEVLTELKLFSLKYFYTGGYRRPPFQIITYLKYLIAGFGTPILPFFIYGMWNWMKQRKHEELLLILSWIVVPLGILAFYLGPQVRYVILIFPALLIMSGYGFSKIYDTSIIKKNRNKNVLVFLLVMILLFPTMIFWFETIQKREANRGCQQEVFVWLNQNSEHDDIIISYGEPSYEYHSKRKVYSFNTSIDELEKIVTTHDNSYFVVHETWRGQKFIKGISDTEQWLKQTYGLIHLKTFECKPNANVITRSLHGLSKKMGIQVLPFVNTWNVYLINKKPR